MLCSELFVCPYRDPTQVHWMISLRCIGYTVGEGTRQTSPVPLV